MLDRFPKSFISIATNGYILYWQEQIRSLLKSGSMEEEDEIILFTNESVRGKAFLKQLGISNYQVIPIPNHGWPEATLLRYEIIGSLEFDDIRPIAIYLDADMLVHKRIDEYIDFELIRKENSMLLVRHPGFWRGNFRSKLNIYRDNPLLGLLDLNLRLRAGGLGSWESNKRSTAFVPYGKRKEYYCGGVWIGSSEKFLEFVKELSREVRKDYDFGLIAKWHDESHLNSWAATNSFLEADPRLCFNPAYSYLKSLPMVIEAVRK
jgi:hypothetical protein